MRLAPGVFVGGRPKLSYGLAMVALRKIGYAGPVAVEPFNAKVKAMSAGEAAAAASAAMDRVLEL